MLYKNAQLRKVLLGDSSAQYDILLDNNLVGEVIGWNIEKWNDVYHIAMTWIFFKDYECGDLVDFIQDNYEVLLNDITKHFHPKRCYETFYRVIVNGEIRDLEDLMLRY
jgi:hypothetical protein